MSQRENGCESTSVILPFIRSFSNGRGVRSGFQQRGDRGLGGQSDPWGGTCAYGIGWVDLGVFGKKCFDFFGLQETVSRNSYMTTGLYRYSLAQPAILPPAQHMRGTSKIGSFNLSISKIIFDK